MINFALDPETNDMTLDADGNWFLTSTRIADVAQILRNRLQTFLGEVPTDLTRGVDYHGIVFDEFLSQDARINELVRVIIDTDGVETVEDFTVSPNRAAGELGYDFTIVTDAGDIQFQNLL